MSSCCGRATRTGRPGADCFRSEGFERRRAREQGIEGRGGAVTAIQRCGSALNTNIHFHTLVAEGVFELWPNGSLRFVPAPVPPTDVEVARLLVSVRRRIVRLVRRHGIELGGAKYHEGSTLTVGDHTWEVQQFHFHARSEHTVDGIASPLELHIVHEDENGDLAVVGVLIEEGAENAALATVFDHLPAEEGEPEEIEGVEVNVPTCCRQPHPLGCVKSPACTGYPVRRAKTAISSG